MIVMHVFENHYYHYVIIMMKMMYVYSRFDAVRSGENMCVRDESGPAILAGASAVFVHLRSLVVVVKMVVVMVIMVVVVMVITRAASQGHSSGSAGRPPTILVWKRFAFVPHSEEKRGSVFSICTTFWKSRIGFFSLPLILAKNNTFASNLFPLVVTVLST